MNTIFLLIGLSGVTLQLVCFALLESGKISANNPWFHLCNFFGSVLLIIYGTIEAVWPFVILDVIWGYYAIRHASQDMKKLHVRRFFRQMGLMQ